MLPPHVGLLHGELTGKVLEIFYSVYNELGYGFLESVYRDAMLVALRAAGFRAEKEVPIDVWFRGNLVGAFFADIVVEDLVILELKSARAIDPAHEAQTLNYLRATHVEVALILNFGTKPEFRRLAFENSRKRRNGTN
jgi:GxxExxY protein